MMPSKRILCLDFDGVINSYKTGWTGPRDIPDPPTKGAMQFLTSAVNDFKVYIFSSRSKFWFGRRAMKKWLMHWLTKEMGGQTATSVMSKISWPTRKPPAYVTIDDRAIQFTGEWPTLDEIKEFQPWYRRKE